MLKFIVLLTAFVFTLACGGGSGSSSSSSSPGSSTKYDDKGDFILFVEVNNKDLGKALEDVFQEVVTELNKYVALPHDVGVYITDCGTQNAFYDPKNKRIIMCTELFGDIYNLYYANNNTREAAVILALLGFNFVFYHELGHALVNIYSLPVLGKEEDAVDSMAVVLTVGTATDNESREIAVQGALAAGWYMYNSTFSTPYYATHSMSNVRLANIVCWAGGAYPTALSGLFKTIFNSMVQAGRDCEREYTQQRDSVKKLIAPMLKRDLTILSGLN